MSCVKNKQENRIIFYTFYVDTDNFQEGEQQLQTQDTKLALYILIFTTLEIVQRRLLNKQLLCVVRSVNLFH